MRIKLRQNCFLYFSTPVNFSSPDLIILKFGTSVHRMKIHLGGAPDKRSARTIEGKQYLHNFTQTIFTFFYCRIVTSSGHIAYLHVISCLLFQGTNIDPHWLCLFPYYILYSGFKGSDHKSVLVSALLKKKFNLFPRMFWGFAIMMVMITIMMISACWLLLVSRPIAWPYCRYVIFQYSLYKLQGVPKKVGINDLVWFDYDLIDSDCVIWS